MSTIYVEAQHDRDRNVVRLVARSEHGGVHAVTRPAASQETAAAEFSAFVKMYRDMGSRVVA